MSDSEMSDAVCNRACDLFMGNLDDELRGLFRFVVQRPNMFPELEISFSEAVGDRIIGLIFQAIETAKREMS